MAESADFFLRTPTLIASNFVALWSIDPLLKIWKDLTPSEYMSIFQEPYIIQKICFAVSKWPHFHRAYSVTIRKRSFIALYGNSRVRIIVDVEQHLVAYFCIKLFVHPIAVHGDWPWMVALYKNGLHVCDATLVDQQWIMTTASCFQG